MTDPIVIVGDDGRAYVSLAEHEQMRRKKALAMDCLHRIAREMNKFADALEAEDASLETETRPAPLGD